jgi:hypothetical protein
MKTLKALVLGFGLVIVLFFLTIDLYFVYLEISGQHDRSDFLSKTIMSKIDSSFKNEQ